MLKIVKYPHPTLRQKAKTIAKITPQIQNLGRQLIKTLAADPDNPEGVGLAANQVDKLHRMFVIQMPNKKFEAILNPRILKSSKKMLSSLPKENQFLEGCLSFPGYYGFVNRPIKVKVTYKTLKGLDKQTTLTTPHSSYFQHELDHLNAVLFIDHLQKNQQPIYLADKKGRLQLVKNPFLNEKA